MAQSIFFTTNKVTPELHHTISFLMFCNTFLMSPYVKFFNDTFINRLHSKGNFNELFIMLLKKNNPQIRIIMPITIITCEDCKLGYPDFTIFFWW